MIEVLSSRIREENVRTPAFVFDLDVLAHRARKAKNCWAQAGAWTSLAYPYKTNAARAVVSALKPSYQFAEVSSGYEFSLAIDDGFSGPEILWGGPSKKASDIATAMNNGCWLKVDSFDEVEAIELHSKSTPHNGKFMVRLAHSIDGRWSRFGLSPEEAVTAILRLHKLSDEPVGIHLHVGHSENQPEELAGACSMYAELIRLAVKLAGSRSPMAFSVGGGFPYHSTLKNEVDLDESISRAARLLRHQLSDDLDVDALHMIAEPGRVVVQPSGVLVSRVISRKTRNGRCLVVVDTSVTHLKSSHGSRPVLFDPPRPGTDRLEIVGACCFESDVISTLTGTVPEVGDLVFFSDVGAYDFSTVVPWFRDSIEVKVMNGGALEDESPRWSRVS